MRSKGHTCELHYFRLSISEVMLMLYRQESVSSPIVIFVSGINTYCQCSIPLVGNRKSHGGALSLNTMGFLLVCFLYVSFQVECVGFLSLFSVAMLNGKYFWGRKFKNMIRKYLWYILYSMFYSVLSVAPFRTYI